MPYIPPQDVTAPKEHWKLHRVIIGGAEGTPAYALGTWIWDGEENRCIGTRWNGYSDKPTGWPQIFANACWHILDEKLNDAVIAMLEDYRDKIYAMRFLNGEEV